MRGSSPRFRAGGIKCYPEPEEILKFNRIAMRKLTTERKLLEEIISQYIKDYESEHGTIELDARPEE